MISTNVLVLNPAQVIFQGEAKSVIVPGEQGLFEILPYHKRLLSRLVSGTMHVDDQNFRIRRGVVKVNQNNITVIVEEEA